MTEIYTRKQYMEDSQTAPGIDDAHHRYFAQFVTPATISVVVSCIGAARILASIDPDMNDIPLALWDKLAPNLPGSGGFVRAGDYYTLANGVCLAKCAARIWRKNQESKN